jgi:hypothetical protein
MYRNGSTIACLPARSCADRAEPWAASPAPAGQIEGEDIRHDLVERVRREIEAGTYDTPERWEAALERLAERLTGR